MKHNTIVFKIVNDPRDTELPPPGLVTFDNEGDDTFEMHAFYPQYGGRRVIAFIHREGGRVDA